MASGRYRPLQKGIALLPEDWEVEKPRPRSLKDLPAQIKSVVIPPIKEGDEPLYAVWHNPQRRTDPKPFSHPDALAERLFGAITPDDFTPRNPDLATFYLQERGIKPDLAPPKEGVPSRRGRRK